MIFSFNALSSINSDFKLAKAGLTLGVLIIAGLTSVGAGATEFKKPVLSASTAECEILNRSVSTMIDDDAVTATTVHYVIASNSNAHPNSCLGIEIGRICDLADGSEKLAIEFTSLTNGSFYQASKTYRLSGLCTKSSDPNDVRLVNSAGNQVAFQRRRHFQPSTDWTLNVD